MNDPSPSSIGAPRGGWLVAWIVFVVLGSAAPFSFQAIPLDAAFDRFREALVFKDLGSRTDVLANFLLFIPLHFLALAWSSVEGRSSIAFRSIPAVLLFGLLLSLAVEFLQVFIPSRSPSVVDIAAQTAGGLAGIACWLVLGPVVGRWSQRLGPALPLYLVLLLLLHLLPCDLSLSPYELVRKYRRGLVVVWPLWTNDIPLLRVIEKTLQQVVLFAPLGWLLANRDRHASNAHTVLGIPGSALLVGLGLVAGLESFHLVVVGRYFDTRDVVAGWAGLVVGWALARGGLPRLASNFSIASWIAMVVVLGWLPFDFDLVGRGDPVIRPPIADYQEADYLHAFEQAIHRFLLFVPGGAMLAFRTRRGRVGVGMAAVLAVVVEAGQLFLPSRVFSLTDVAIATLGAAAGAWLVDRGQAAPSARNGVD